MLDTTQIVDANRPGLSLRPDLLGDIILERQIGSGATSTVYLGHDVNDPTQRYAVKVITQFLMMHDDARRRWEREAELIIRLNHPNIVRGIRHGLVDNRPFLVMEYLQGESLMHRVRRLGKLPEEEVLSIAEATLLALQAAHEMRVIHRDIKPANIIWLQDGTVKVMDFGLAKFEDDRSITATGHIVGTPMYVSPEQARCDYEITIQSDLYSLGATLYHLVSGEPPFSELNTSLLLTRKITDDVPDVRFANPQATAALAFLIHSLTRRELPERLPTPAAALKLLHDLRNGSVTTTNFLPARKESRAQLQPMPSSEAVPMASVLLQTIADDSKIETRPHFLAAGQVLFYEDDASRECYILLGGKVDVIKSGRSIATIDEPGAFIGEMGPLRGAPRSATVMAREETVLLVIPENDFHGFFSRHAEMALQLARTLATRLEATSCALEKMSTQNAVLSRHVREMSAVIGKG